VHMKDADFLSYSDPKITDELKGASACLWAIGIRPSQARDEVSAKRVCVEFTAAAARAFQRAYADSASVVETKAGAGAETGDSATTSNSDGKPPFRFVYISGAAIERDQSKSLWYLGNYRRMRVSIHYLITSPYPRSILNGGMCSPVPGRGRKRPLCARRGESRCL
jgi:hypothetical protein